MTVPIKHIKARSWEEEPVQTEVAIPPTETLEVSSPEPAFSPIETEDALERADDILPIAADNLLRPISALNRKLMSLKEFCNLPKLDEDESLTLYAVRVLKLLRNFRFDEEQSIQAICSQLQLPTVNTWTELMKQIDIKEPTEARLKWELRKLSEAVRSNSPFTTMKQLRAVTDIMVAHYHRMPAALNQYKASILPFLPPLLRTSLAEAVRPYLEAEFSYRNFKTYTEQIVNKMSTY